MELCTSETRDKPIHMLIRTWIMSIVDMNVSLKIGWNKFQAILTPSLVQVTPNHHIILQRHVSCFVLCFVCMNFVCEPLQIVDWIDYNDIRWWLILIGEHAGKYRNESGVDWSTSSKCLDGHSIQIFMPHYFTVYRIQHELRISAANEWIIA